MVRSVGLVSLIWMFVTFCGSSRHFDQERGDDSKQAAMSYKGREKPTRENG